VTLLAGLLLGTGERVPLAGVPVSPEGLVAGLLMNLRAFTLVLGGTLLASAVTRDRFIAFTSRLGLRHFDPAFTTALETMPRVSRSWARARGRERASRFRAVARLLVMLSDLARWSPAPARGLLGVTGRRGAGKTSLLAEAGRRAEEEGLRVGGILQERSDDRLETVGYMVRRWGTGEELQLARRRPEGGFSFSLEAFGAADRWLREDGARADLLLVDELGLLEAKGGGHAGAVAALLQRQPPPLLLAALRKDKLGELAERFGFGREEVLDLDDGGESEAFLAQVLAEARSRKGPATEGGEAPNGG
jgi:nucleoside-triphosphatase THEP1